MPPRFNHSLLARVRTELGLTQDAAATAVGVDVRTYRRYESGAVNDATAGFEVRNASRRQLLARLSAELGIPEADLVIAAPAPAQWFTCHAHTLPRAPHFVGRDPHLARLAAWTAPGCLAVIAVGGAGKTSLVERWLARLGDGPHPGGVFVWSFYDDERSEALLARAVDYFAPDLHGHGDHLDTLQTALAAGPPHLVILDGLEVAQASHGRVEDAALRRLLLHAVRGLGNTRVLLTSRLAPADLLAWEGDGLTTLHLGDLSEREGRDLLARWGLRGDQLPALAERVGGHALSLAMLGSYVGTFLGGDVRHARTIDLEPAARDDVQARKLLGVLSAYARALAPAERDLLARLALFPGGADLPLLTRLAAADPALAGALAGLAEPALTAIVARLGRLGLVARVGDHRFAAHPFVAEYFRSLLTATPVAAIHDLECQHLIARLDRHGATHTTDLLDVHESLLLHTLRSGRADEAMSIYTRTLGGFDHLGLRLGAMSRGARIVRMFAADGDPAHIAPTLAPARRARLVYDWGLYSGALGDLRQALACYRVHTEIVRSAGSLVGLTTSLRTRAYTERLTGALTDAMDLASAAIDAARAADSPGDLARGLALAGRIAHDLGHDDLAKNYFAQARATGDSSFARRGLWHAEHLLERGDPTTARAILEATLPGLQSLGWSGHTAHAHTILGLLDLEDPAPDLERARDHLTAARTWTTATGEVEVQLRCHELAARIATLAGDDADPEIQRGHRLAATCGFGLHLVRLTNLALAHALARGAATTTRVDAALATARAHENYAWGLADALRLADLAARSTAHTSE
jgi:transcriptional regulator with XRE-family HTH domain